MSRWLRSTHKRTLEESLKTLNSNGKKRDAINREDLRIIQILHILFGKNCQVQGAIHFSITTVSGMQGCLTISTFPEGISKQRKYEGMGH